MSSKLSNDGKNAIRDALADGRNISVDEGAVGDGESDPSSTDTGLESELDRYTTDNQTRGTGESRFDFTVPENSDIDGQTLREVGLFIGDDMLGRIRFADAIKESGQRVEFEVTATADNPE